MSQRIFRRSAASALVAALTLACSSEAPITAPRVPVLGLFSAVFSPPTGSPTRTPQVERVEVCKDYVMTSSATPPTANFTANGNAFTLTNGQCREVWLVGGAGEDVLVTEAAIPGFTTAYRVTDLAGNVTGPTSGSSTTVHPGGNPRAGFLIEFINTEVVLPPPPTGCTLTQGYWKNHSELGPAPYDTTWARLPNGANTSFYLSGKTWHEVFLTAPKGNAYYNLAHQFMAATLNGLAGANQTAVTQELADGTTLFHTYTPAQIGALKGDDPLKKQFLALASTLDDYNNGRLSPAHCD
jgi:hypothetical protein